MSRVVLFLSLLTAVSVLACSGQPTSLPTASPVPPTATATAIPANTPDIPATVAAGIATGVATATVNESTPTEGPTSTPSPTATAAPISTPTPAPTATPEPTATPTPQPTATPVPEPGSWSSTGLWYRNVAHELALLESLDGVGTAEVATLDAVLTGGRAELSLSLGCVAGLQVAYLTPYSFVVSPLVDTYAVGIWNADTGEWEGDLGSYTDPVVTDDNSSVFISNRAQLRQIVRILMTAAANRNPDLALNIGMFDSTTEDGASNWGEFDPTGLQDVLGYLPCY